MLDGCSNYKCAVKGKTPRHRRCLGIRKHTRGACRCVQVDAIEARISVQGHPVGPRVDEFHDRSVICAWLLSGGLHDILALERKESVELLLMEAVQHLSRCACHCQVSDPDVTANAHLEFCMVGLAQKHLGLKVTKKDLYK